MEGAQKWVGPNPEKHPWCFTIELSSGRTFFLGAPSQETMQDWVDKLKATFSFYIKQNNPAEAGRACADELSSGADLPQEERFRTIATVLFL